MNADDLRQAVLDLRTSLPDVVQDDSERAEIAVVLDRALACSGDAAAEELRNALEFNPTTRLWARDRLAQPDGLREIAGAGLPGLSTGVSGELFVCPYDDFDFVRESVGEDVPPCPIHQITLVHENA